MKYYFYEYITLILKWFEVFLVEANLFQVFIKLQSDLIIRAIIIRRLNFKTKFKIEIEPKSSIINIISILKRDNILMLSSLYVTLVVTSTLF